MVNENVVKTAASLAIIFDIVLLILISALLYFKHDRKNIIIASIISLIIVVNLGLNSKLIKEANEEDDTGEYKKGVFIFNIVIFSAMILFLLISSFFLKTLTNDLKIKSVKITIGIIATIYAIILILNSVAFNQIDNFIGYI